MKFEEIFLKAVKKKITFAYNCQKREELHLGFGVDDHYVRCMSTSIVSICRHNEKENICFHILTNTLSDNHIKNIEVLAKNLFVDINIYFVDDTAFLRLPTQVHFPKSIYYRYIFPCILKIPRILYLDADIVCIGKIDELFRQDLNGNVVAAVADMEWMGNKRNRVLKLVNHIYFNSGVLLIDIEQWTKFNVINEVLHALEKDDKKFRYPDQDALNLVLAGQVHYLDRKWNHLNNIEEGQEESIFLHFAAHPKPWNIAWPLSPLCTDFTRDLYRQYEQLTPFKDMPLEMPGNYKEMKIYAKCLWRSGQYAKSLLWQIKYIKNKFSV